LLTFFNPDTGIRDAWYFEPNIGNIEGWSYNMSSSKITFGMTYGSYEGFAYLGAGILVLISANMLFHWGELKSRLQTQLSKRTKLLLVFLLVYVLGFPRITIGNVDIPPMRVRNWFKFFEPFPMFPSSGRAVSIFAFGMIIISLFYLVQLKSKTLITFIIGVILTIQLIDLIGPLKDRYVYARQKSETQINLNSAPSELRLIAKDKKYLRIYPLENHTSEYDQIAYWAWELGLETNAIYSARFNYSIAKEFEQKDFQLICKGQFSQEIIYAIEDTTSGIGQFSECNLSNLRRLNLGSRIILSRG
jgi:hypothetical protein